MKSPYASTRREFLERSGTLSAASLTLALASEMSAHAANGSGELKLGLVGCGGRGAGAANQALTADDGLKLFSMCDVNRETMDTAADILEKQKPGRLNVSPERRYSDFDGFKRVIADCDVIILATSPGFRPQHFEEVHARAE
jgi:predicted dehydrogenase